jgi:hypothetical protein
MTASFWLVTGLACAQFGGMAAQNPANPDPNAPKVIEDAPAPRPAPSKIVAVTVYQGQALVTREVAIPEGVGTIEVVVTPLPGQTVDSSLYTEGSEGLRVLSTRFRTRAVKEDTRAVVRAKHELIKTLDSEAIRIEKEISVQEADLQYLRKLEGFTGATLTNLAEKGRLESAEILAISKFVMESRGSKSKVETDLRQQLKTNNETADFAKLQLAELSSGSSRFERDAVIVVQKMKNERGTVKLGYLVGSARWSPQYRLRGTADDAPVRLEYLAAVTQQTGEDWPDVRVTLSTARPSVDAAPPDLLPLKMDIGTLTSAGPIEAPDDRSKRISNELSKPIAMKFATETPLADVIKSIQDATQNEAAGLSTGIPIYVDPQGLQDADKTMASTVSIDLEGIPLRTTLRLLLAQIGMVYRVKDGLLTITSSSIEDDTPGRWFRDDLERSADQGQPSGVAILNRDAATGQSQEMRVGDESAPENPGSEKDGPSVSFNVEGKLGIPSRPDPQLLEVGRIELPAEYYAKAVPVLTPRVYRLAKLTNKSEFVLLPGEATAYVGGEFVGRMKLPLVAAGEPFIVGFGVDPQLQVSRRLVKKTRTVQGGNQVFAYEFRIGLRNYRAVPVKVQLWDRLPTPEGESVVVSLVQTTTELSADPAYQRTARKDNLLLWDLVVPQGTIADKTMYLNYEFRLEYSRDLPQPRFISGGLKEGSIGGGAMGGMGGMGGGMGGMGGMQ